jgi:hypothetical protein
MTRISCCPDSRLRNTVPLSPLGFTSHFHLFTVCSSAVVEEMDETRHYARSSENLYYGQLTPIITTLLVLSYVALGLRLWTRTRVLKILGWDDYMMMLCIVWYNRRYWPFGS